MTFQRGDIVEVHLPNLRVWRGRVLSVKPTSRRGDFVSVAETVRDLNTGDIETWEVVVHESVCRYVGPGVEVVEP